MRTVNIAELKNRLSSYIQFAKAGEEIIIRDRNKLVAMLVPIVTDGVSARDLDLVAAGLMRLPKKPFDIDELLKMPRPGGSGNAATQAVLDEREEGWRPGWPMPSGTAVCSFRFVFHPATNEKTDALARLFLPVVRWCSAVEVHSALTRVHRLGGVNDSGTRSALAFLGAMRLGWREIAPSDQLRRLAETLLDRYVGVPPIVSSSLHLWSGAKKSRQGFTSSPATNGCATQRRRQALV